MFAVSKTTSKFFLSLLITSSVDLPIELSLKAEGMGTNLWKMVAGSDEVLGDESFDALALVRGGEAEVTAKLNEPSREVILEMITNKIKFETFVYQCLWTQDWYSR